MNPLGQSYMGMAPGSSSGLMQNENLLHQSSTTIDAVQAMLQPVGQKKKRSLVESFAAMFEDAEFEETGYPPLHKAAVMNDIADLNRLLHVETDIDVNERTNDGLRWTPLHIACSKGHAEIALSLLHKGARLNDGDDNGWTPLHLAADGGYDKIVEDLVSSGAMLHIKTSSGQTPLHLAAKKGHRGCIDILMRYGAELEVTNSIGQTPRAVAQQFNSKAVDQSYKPPLQPTTAILDGLEVRRGVQRNKQLAEFKSTFRLLRRKKKPESATKRPGPTDITARKRAGASGLSVEEQLKRWEAYRTDKQQVLRESLKSLMCGQDVAIRFSSEAVRRRDARQRAEDFPLVMLFVGGPGIGKSTVAQELAYHTFPDVERNYFEVDMSRFVRKEAALNFNEIFYDILGFANVSDAKRRHVHAVVVFKNHDKADVDVNRALCDLFKTGLLCDRGGYPLVQMDKCVFIMTHAEVGVDVVRSVFKSHASSTGLGTSHPGLQSDLVAQIKAKLGDVLDVAFGKYARDLRRHASDIIPFVPLRQSEIVGAANLHLKWKAEELRAVGIRFTWASQVADFIGARYDEEIGCESLKRAIFAHVTERIIDAQDLGKLTKGDSLRAIPKGKDEISIRATFQLKGLPKELADSHSFYL